MARLCTIILAVSSVWVFARADDDTEAMVQRVAGVKRHRAPTPEEAPICTKQELDDWTEKVNAVIEEDRRQQAAKQRNESLHAAEVLKQHLQPLVNGTLAANDAVQAALRPAVKKIIIFGLQHLLKRKLPNSSLVDFNQTIDALTEAAVTGWDHGREVFLEGLRVMDQGLNKSFDALPDKIKVVLRKRAVPEELDNNTIIAYLSEKVVPVLASEMFPQLAEPLAIWAHTPNTEPEFNAYMTDEVVPFILNKVPGMIHQPPKLPERQCVTCKERYNFLVTDMGSPESCMAFCVPLVPQCKTAATESCLKLFAPCLRCHTEKMAQLDKCKGTDESADIIKRINAASDVLSGASVKLASIDNFLTKLSESVVD